MATKRLARTIIEGGRDRRNQFERRYSNRKERRLAASFAHKFRFDPDYSEETIIPKRELVYRHHDDRLGAVKRWLASFVGRPWSEVRREIAQRFDTRNLAGQHIVFDHLLMMVKGGGVQSWYYHFDFEVDEDGVLRKSPEGRFFHRRRKEPGQSLGPKELYRWTGGRRVGRRGSRWYWFQPTAFVYQSCKDRRCWREHEEREGKKCHRVDKGSFRQSSQLTLEEEEFWRSLNPATQEYAEFIPE